MKKIKMKNQQKLTVEETFKLFIASSSAKGLTEKTLKTYQHHFNAVFKRADSTIDITEFSQQQMNELIAELRKEGLSDNSINSYTRTLKAFFSWCNANGYTNFNISLYKASEAIQETYTDEELLLLLEKPKKNCSFAEYRNWVIINFLINSGCRAMTIRNIQNQDVDLINHQIVLRHTKSRKNQVIPLCNEMVVILKNYMNVRNGSAEEYLFCNEFGGQMKEGGLRYAIIRYNTSRGVSKTSIHAFRHTFARKYLIDCGGDAFTLQKIMGHSTLAMTKHYCNIFNADIVKDYDKRSPLTQLSNSRGTAIKK